MDISWTTVLCSFIGSIVASGVFSGVVACVLGAYIQHKNDKRLAYYKSEIQLILDEHQTKFNWWYEEKAKAVKEFYYCAVMWYQEMRDFRSIAKSFAPNIPVEIQNDLAKRIELIIQMKDSSYKNWTFLRLYLKREELLITDHFFSKGHSIIKDIGNQIKKTNFLSEGEKIDHDLTEMLFLVEELREKLQEILKIQEAKP